MKTKSEGLTHVAGPFKDGEQKCSRCGETLLTGRTREGYQGFEENSNVTKQGPHVGVPGAVFPPCK